MDLEENSVFKSDWYRNLPEEYQYNIKKYAVIVYHA